MQISCSERLISSWHNTCRSAVKIDELEVGIANVNRRIKLYYGEEYGLILESEPDIGTKVIVVVPKTRQAEKK